MHRSKAHLSVLSVALTLLLILIALTQPTLAGIRLERDVEPVFQLIELTVDADRPDYSGSVTIDLRVNQPTKSFRFHSEGLTIDTLILTDSSGLLASSFEQVNDEELVVTTENELTQGSCLLEISFHNEFDTRANSLYRLDVDGRGYLFTQFEDTEAREAFPCWDEPSFKFPYQLILTAPSQHVVISNTPIESKEQTKGWTRTVFKKTPPLPSYLLAIATGPLETVELPGMSIPSRIVTVSGKSDLVSEVIKITPPVLRALEKYFDRPYPYEKLDLIAVPEFWAGAMENAGAITFRETILLLDPESITIGQRRRLVSVTAHELAHMWFGDLVTMEWWDDLWLNESFATWMGNKVTQQLFPQYETDISRVRSMGRVLSSDARPSSVQIRQPVDSMADLLGNIRAVYSKGHAILSMFEQWIGEKDFRKAVISYIDKNAWGNATADDLWKAVDDLSGKNLSTALASFTDQPGAPFLTFELIDQKHLKVTQERLSNYGVEAPSFTPWQIPIVVKYGSGDRVTSSTFFLKDTSAIFDLVTDTPVSWIYPHSTASGYYRWTMSSDLMNELSVRASEIMSPRERIAFLDNMIALLNTGSLGGNELMQAIASFSQDKHPRVISSAIGALSIIEETFIDSSNRSLFSQFVQQALKPALERIGMQPVENEDENVTLLRPSLIGWLGDEGKDEKLLSFADKNFRQYLESPDKIHPSLVGVTISLACIDGDSTLFAECRKRFENARIPTERSRYLSALGSFQRPELQKMALDYVLSGELRPQELIVIPYSIANESPEKADIVFQWMMREYDAIISRIPPPSSGMLAFLASGCSSQRLKLAREFFEMPEHQSPGIGSRISRITDQVTDCVNLRERELAQVNGYLEREFPDGK